MNARTVWTVANAERRRVQHRYGASRRQRAVVLLATVVLLPVLGLVLVAGHGLGQDVAAGETALLDVARWSVPGSVVLFAVMGAVNARRRLLDFGAQPLLLTTVPTRDLVYGLLLADALSWTLGLVGPAIPLVGAFALGAGSPAAFVVGATAILLLTVASILTGIVVGLLARLAPRRVPLSKETRSLLGTVGGVGGALAGGLAGAYAGSTGASAADLGLDALADGPPPVPLGYYADWLFVGTPAFEGVTLAAAGSALFVVAVLPLSLVAIRELAPRLWHADAALPTPEDATTHDADDTGSTDAAALDAVTPRSVGRRAPWLSTRVGVVADGLLRRAARTPTAYAHGSYYVVVVGLVVAAGVVNPEAFWLLLGAGLSLLGVWLAGGLFGLNPLGEEEGMLGQLVLSTTPARTFVRARALAGVVVALPLLFGGTLAMTYGGLAPLDALVLGGFLSGLSVVSATSALGLGTLLPRTEPGTVLDATETVLPDTLAIAVHAVLVLVLAVAGTVLLLAPLDPTVQLAGLAGVVLVGALLLDGGYRFAVDGLDAYGRPRRPSRRFTVELVVGLAFLGVVASTTVSLAALAFVPLDGLPGFVLAFVASYAGYAAVVVAYVLGADRDWAILRVRPPARSDLRPLAIGLAAPFGVYAVLIAGVVLGDVPVVEHSLGGEIAAGGPAFALALVVLALLVNAPVEELFFRGVLQSRLAEAFPERTAIAVAALVFSLVHLPVYADGSPLAVVLTLTALAVLGAIWGWVFARTDSVVPAALCHGLYNAALFSIAYATLL